MKELSHFTTIPFFLCVLVNTYEMCFLINFCRTDRINFHVVGTGEEYRMNNATNDEEYSVHL
jgi:hypothetical protein